jgi:acyl-coenzyme A thioesterase PaaI-like protein
MNWRRDSSGRGRHLSPPMLMRFINFWPPLLFSGIHVVSSDPGMRNVVVELRLTFWNRNAAGTQFGGNIYSMTDPFYPLMLMANLGAGYAIWDQDAHIRFVTPGKSALRAVFHLSDEKLAEIRLATAGDRKYLADFEVRISDLHDTLVATVRKVIYIRPYQV